MMPPKQPLHTVCRPTHLGVEEVLAHLIDEGGVSHHTLPALKLASDRARGAVERRGVDVPHIECAVHTRSEELPVWGSGRAGAGAEVSGARAFRSEGNGVCRSKRCVGNVSLSPDMSFRRAVAQKLRQL